MQNKTVRTTFAKALLSAALGIVVSTANIHGAAAQISGGPNSPTRNSATEAPNYVNEVKDAAFETAITGLLPMRPDQIQELIERLDESQKAAAVPPGEPQPRPEVKVESISLDPGKQPPELLVAAGYVTTVNFLDSSGMPWPISDVVYGGNFSITSPATGGELDLNTTGPNAPEPAPIQPNNLHVVHITPLGKHIRGNLSVSLVGLATPVTFRIRTDKEVVFYRYDARLPQFGPMAQVPLIQRPSGVVAGDDVIMAILDGVPPQGTERMTVSGVDNRTSAWMYRDRIFVRSPLKLLSPGWDASVSSSDGMTVYALPEAPVLIFSDSGVTVRARINPREISTFNN